MKYYLRLFGISFLIFFLVIWGIERVVISKNAELSDDIIVVEKIESSGDSEFDKLIASGERVNVLLVGADGERSDTMMIGSFDHKNKLMDIISIPRDTYHYVKGKDRLDQKKINAIYGMSGDLGGLEGMRLAAEEILGIPIQYYVEVDYKAVSAIVDVVGGVEINVMHDMYYDDPFATPPLHINLKQGKQVLDGNKALQYIRWRKNNDGSWDNGDISRIGRQQEFAIEVAKKAFGLKLPLVIKTAFDYVDTNMNIGDMLNLGRKGIGMDFNEIRTYNIPGNDGYKSGVSFYFHDEQLTKNMIKEIYERGNDSEEAIIETAN